MISITLNRKKLAVYSLALVVLAGGWWFLRELRHQHTPVEVEVDKKNVTSRRQPVSPPIGEKEFFVDCRLTRDRIRSQRIELLKEIANNPDSSSDVRDQAQMDLMKMTDGVGKENEIEKLIIARGFKDAVVMLQPRTATVIVQTRALPRSDSDRIAEIVAKATGLEPGSIFVISKP